MPDMDGMELQAELAQRGSSMPVIVITGHGDVPLAVRAMKAGAGDFLEKPFARDILLAAVKRALEAGEARSNPRSTPRGCESASRPLTRRANAKCSISSWRANRAR